MNAATESKTLTEKHADELLRELKEATRLVAAYAHEQQDMQRFSQHQAILRHLARFGNLIRRCESRA